MKLHQVIRIVKHKPIPSEYWFRPVSWRGHHAAYALDFTCKYVEYVPTPRGGQRSMTYHADLLEEDWEIVTPDEVCEGR